MNFFRRLSRLPTPWFTIGMVSIFLFSAMLRFWQLGRFNTLVFDEVYYAKFANNYLTQTEFFNAHPPLSQYIIAISIWIGSHLPFGQEIVNNETGSTLSPWTYRWVNALTGSFIPVVVGAIAYQLTYRRSYGFIAALLIALDGLFLVESRYALNNIYLVIFGLLGQLCLIFALQNRQLNQKLWLGLAGVSFGASAGIKWNGLAFLLAVYLLWIFAWIIKAFAPKRRKHESTSPLENLTRLNLIQFILNLLIIPIITYSLLWIPHIILNPKYGFLEMQKQIFSYHQRIGSGPDTHPYCAQWLTWPLSIRPVVYFYKNTGLLDKPELSLPPLPPGIDYKANPVIFDVHAMGNPVIWWLSALAILSLVLILINYIWDWEKKREARHKKIQIKQKFKFPSASEMWLLLYLLLNWLANFLPWAKVTRCTFVYHYMGAVVFAILALAWWVERWLNSRQIRLRIMGITAIFLILFAFVFWMPVYLGLPLSPQSWQLRMWFRSWI